MMRWQCPKCLGTEYTVPSSLSRHVRHEHQHAVMHGSEDQWIDWQWELRRAAAPAEATDPTGTEFGNAVINLHVTPMGDIGPITEPRIVDDPNRQRPPRRHDEGAKPAYRYGAP